MDTRNCWTAAHRDYLAPFGGISVHVYPNRPEIRNSGGLPNGITVESLARGNLSVLRNPDIANVLYLRGMMEKLGRGSLLILRECKEHGLPPPEWSVDPEGVTLTFFDPEVARLLRAFRGEQSRHELQELLGFRDPDHFRTAHLRPALETGPVEMTQPDTPRSRSQRYRLPAAGRRVAQSLVR